MFGSRILWTNLLIGVLAGAMTLSAGAAAEDAPDAEIAEPAAKDESRDEPKVELAPAGTEQRLVDEVRALLDDMRTLREELARARLEKSAMQRELEELRQFIEDHREYGQDFESYRKIREIKAREQRQREIDQARERWEQQRAERQERMRRARETRNHRRAAEREERRYAAAGFTPLGLDVYAGRMGYQYRVRDALRTRITYDPFFGFYSRRDFRDEVDYSEMIISGSIINGAPETRNLGVAITFFDGRGNQVGHEIIQINNARTDVPYPFTSTVSMALNRPFSTSSIYVLYADPADLQ